MKDMNDWSIARPEQREIIHACAYKLGHLYSWRWHGSVARAMAEVARTEDCDKRRGLSAQRERNDIEEWKPSPRQRQIMRMIRSNPGFTTVQLAERYGEDRAILTTIISRLGVRGVVISNGEHNGRRHWLNASYEQGK